MSWMPGMSYSASGTRSRRRTFTSSRQSIVSSPRVSLVQGPQVSLHHQARDVRRAGTVVSVHHVLQAQARLTEPGPDRARVDGEGFRHLVQVVAERVVRIVGVEAARRQRPLFVGRSGRGKEPAHTAAEEVELLPGPQGHLPFDRLAVV